MRVGEYVIVRTRSLPMISQIGSGEASAKIGARHVKKIDSRSASISGQDGGASLGLDMLLDNAHFMPIVQFVLAPERYARS